MFEPLQGSDHPPWQPVSGWQMAGASLGFGWFLVLLKTDEDGFVFLDHVNLVFHEAGHPIFGLLGPTLGLYGGTLGQLVMPLLVLGTFRRQGHAVGCAVAALWFFENFLNIARYMADARAQVLPLVGGGEHDWADIFTRWGVLASDTAIAQLVSAAGWVGMLVSWAWLGWRWMKTGAASPRSAG